MHKRFLSLLLVFSLVLSLAGCGKKNDADSSADAAAKGYTSNKAMDVFDTIEAIKELKDFTFDLQISSVDADTGELTDTLTQFSGESYASTKQASLSIALGDTPFTTIAVDDDTLYLDAASAANCLAEKFSQIENYHDSEALSEDAASVAEQLPADYAAFDLTEDPWTTLEGSSFQTIKELAGEVYSSIKKDTAKKVSSSKSTCTLSLGLGNLQTELLKATNSLVDNKADYQAFFTQYLDANFDSELLAYGWTAQELLDSFWLKYESANEDMEALDAVGSWNDWSIKVITCGDKTSGYTLDLTDLRDDPRNYLLRVYPAEAQEVALPAADEYVSDDEISHLLAALLTSTRVYKDVSSGSLENYTEDYTDEYTGSEDDQEVSDYPEYDQEYVEEKDIDGYEKITSTDMVTMDGQPFTVPIPSGYDTIEANTLDYGVDEVLVGGTGYRMEYFSIEDRGLKQTTEESINSYVSLFQDDWGYAITQNATAVQMSQDGSFAAAATGYYDPEGEQNVTVLIGNFSVEGSDYVIGFDLYLYEGLINEEGISAVQELFDYLGTELPAELPNL